MRWRTLVSCLVSALALSIRAMADEEPRIVVVVVEPTGATGFRASVGERVTTDAAAMMDALRTGCDGRNHERGDFLVILARDDTSLATLSIVTNIATKPCLDARRVLVFGFDHAQQRMWRAPPATDNASRPLAFDSDPEAFRSLLPARATSPAHSR